MTVKCITTDEKAQIIQMFGTKTYQQKELAYTFFTSERTINRVLVEAGVLPPVQRIKAEAHEAMQILKKHNISVVNLDNVLKNTQPKLSSQIVQDYLCNASEEELGRLFWEASVNQVKKELECIHLGGNSFSLEETDEVMF